jgi:hypothetical protein
MTPGGPQQQKRKPCAEIKKLKTLDKKKKKTSNAPCALCSALVCVMRKQLMPFSGRIFA